MNHYFSKYYFNFIAIVLYIGFLLSNTAHAQISAGGIPIKVDHAVLMKSGFKQQISMPKLDFNTMAIKASKNTFGKNLKFGHAFKVHFTPENAGQIFYTEYFKIWQLEIESIDAFAINLVFDKYHLPSGARLFICNHDGSKILGAFTSRNNKESNILAIHPLPGDKIRIQYEEPLSAAFKGELSIGTIVHAYLDIFDEKNLFYPRRTSGTCNVDVQCENESDLELQKRAVCRVFAVDKLGTATLVNNTRQDGTPYLLSAYHVFDNTSTSDSSIFSFNYESPFCTSLEGSDYMSISGAKTIAGRMETDMILLELSESPPPSFRPYFSGWDKTNTPPENSYCIHHPNGDTKKISHDTGICAIGRYHNGTLLNGHWKVMNWETGTTENGSSGAGLFNNKGHLVGTLSGGKASCTNLDYDVFARFDVMYNHYSSNNSQLKHWLNPDDQNIEILNSYDPYAEDQTNCTSISNFSVDDNLPSNKTSELFISKNNLDGFSEVASFFNQVNEGNLEGVSIGIERKIAKNLNPKINLKIYSNSLSAEQVIYAQAIKFENLIEGAINYIPLEEDIRIDGKFYVGFEIPNSEDTLNFYYSELKSETKNTLFFKTNDEWKAFNSVNDQNKTAHLLIEANICAYILSNDTSQLNKRDLISIAPNPAYNIINISFIIGSQYRIKIYNAAGSRVYMQNEIKDSEITINIENYKRGVYFIQAENEIGFQTLKLIKK